MSASRTDRDGEGKESDPDNAQDQDSGLDRRPVFEDKDGKPIAFFLHPSIKREGARTNLITDIRVSILFRNRQIC